MDFCVFHWGLCAAVTSWLGGTEMREEGYREGGSLVTVVQGSRPRTGVKAELELV